jgi:hypothetical protein
MYVRSSQIRWTAETAIVLASLQLTVVCLVDPGAFRSMHAFTQNSCEGAGRLEVVSLAVTEDAPSATLPPVPADTSSQAHSTSASSSGYSENPRVL